MNDKCRLIIISNKTIHQPADNQTIIIDRFFVLSHPETGSRQSLTHVIVSSQSERDGCQIERVGDEVRNVPHVADVLLRPGVPELLDLAPDQTCREEGCLEVKRSDGSVFLRSL